MEYKHIMAMEPFKDLDLIFVCKYGSHLFGTDTPDSDTDYKGVFIPSLEQCILGQIPKSVKYNSKEGEDQKNTSQDIDVEIYSVQYFLHLLNNGDTGALDMLFALSYPEMIMYSDAHWSDLYQARHEFFTSDISSMVRYCRGQAAKYGIKGSRINAVQKVVDFIRVEQERKHPPEMLGEVWHRLPTGDHINFIAADSTNGIEYGMYEVCERRLQCTVTLNYALAVYEKILTNYGGRAQLAAKNEGIDWKAVSHAMRVASQTVQFLEDGDIPFPGYNANYLKMIKQGELDYSDIVAPRLEQEIDYVITLVEDANLPDRVDLKKWENWILKLYELKDREF